MASNCHEWWHTYHLKEVETFQTLFSKMIFDGWTAPHASPKQPLKPFFFVTCLLTGTEKKKTKSGESYAHLFTRKETQGLVVQNLSWSCMTWIAAITIRLREPTSFGHNQRKEQTASYMFLNLIMLWH